MSQQSRLEKLEERAEQDAQAESGDAEKIAFFLTLINWRGDEWHEFLSAYPGNLYPENWTQATIGTIFGNENLDRLRADGWLVVCLFDPAKASHAERIKYVDPSECAAHDARTIPELKDENIFVWGEGEVKPGFFVARVQGTKDETQAA
jgi:hypothetical protein